MMQAVIFTHEPLPAMWLWTSMYPRELLRVEKAIDLWRKEQLGRMVRDRLEEE